jgi:release factor glutamine methyltransferase
LKRVSPSPDPLTVGEALREGARQLVGLSQTPLLDAEILLRHVLEWSREQVYLRASLQLPADAMERFQELLAQRARGRPIAYIVGHKEFYGLDLLVDERVLIPRPETEVLVETAIRRLRPKCQHKACLAADVGTGSGAIALALVANLPNLKVYATDISREALEVARSNCQRLALCDMLVLLHGDLLDPVPEAVDAVLANLPYAVPGEVDPHVAAWEPAIALYSPEAGLEHIRRLLEQIALKLNPDGFVALEIHPPRVTEVLALASQHLPYAKHEIVRDLAGQERVVLLTL